MGVVALVTIFALPNVPGLSTNAIAHAGEPAIGVGATHLPAATGPIPTATVNPGGMFVAASSMAGAVKPIYVPAWQSSAVSATTSAPTTPSSSGVTPLPPLAQIPVSSSSASPRPSVGGFQTGTVTGYACYVTTTGCTFQNGMVAEYATSGGVCGVPPCTPYVRTTTGGPYNHAGFFSMIAPAGPLTIIIFYNAYVSNQTYLFVQNGGSYFVGNISLLPEGSVKGSIYGSDSSHELVTKCTINISVTSRSGLYTGIGGSFSGGSFTVPVPPFPSILTFVPKPFCPFYNSNTYWVNVTSGSLSVLQGVYLPVNTLLQVTVRDAYTHSLATQASFQGCPTGDLSNCLKQARMSTTGIVRGYVPVGYDTLTIYATSPQNGEGMLENTTNIGYVPPEPPGTAFVIPTPFYAVSLGTFYMRSNISFEKQIQANGVPWGTGDVVVTSTSLDGFDQIGNFNPMTGNFTTTTSAGAACFAPNNKAPIGPIFTAPLRDAVTVEPDTGAQCFPPVPTWPIPNDLPVFGNETIVNVTSNNKLTSNNFVNGEPGQDWLNITAGTYLELGVVQSSATQPPAGSPSNIQGTFKDTDQLSGGNSFQSASTYPTGNPAPLYHPGYDPAGCPAGSYYILCVPVPFGPIQVTVSVPGMTNTTWVDIPPGDYQKNSFGLAPALIQKFDTAPLIQVNTNGVQVASGGYGALAFTAAQIEGYIYDNVTKTPPRGDPSISVGLAGTPSGAFSSVNTIANITTGQWGPINANIGWNYVSVTDAGYIANAEWIYVAGGAKPTMAAPVYLTPLGIVQGRVVTETGAGILQAQVKVCPIAAQAGTVNVGSCTPLGATGTTNTAGQYYGTLPDYPLPRGAYQIVASATGFVTNWTWVNVTEPNQLVNASTIGLISQSSIGSNSALPRGTVASSLAEWVDGSVQDSVTGLPVPGSSVTWQAPGGQTNAIGTNDINNLEDFNTSIPTGVYYLNVSATGYLPFAELINVTGLDTNGTFYLSQVPSSLLPGAPMLSPIELVPQMWISGQVVIGPGDWSQVSSAQGLGPSQHVSVAICTQTLICQSGIANLGGFFNVSGPTIYNQKTRIRVVPGVAGTTGTAPNGFTENLSTFVNATGAVIAFNDPVPIEVDIFGIVYGYVRDNSTNNLQPVRWPSATAYNSTGMLGPATLVQGAGGLVTGIISPTAKGQGAHFQASASAYVANATTTPVAVGFGETVALGNISLEHYGWIAGVVVASGGTKAPVPWATASYQPFSATGGAGTNGVANGAGFLNITAPPGRGGTLTLSAPDANATTASNVSINQSATTPLSVALKGSQGGILAWGWVRGQVVDQRFGYAVDQVDVSATGAYAGAAGTPVVTNASGQYMIDAPPSPSDNISLQVTDYASNHTLVTVGFGATVPAPLVNMSGDGIVAGIVVSFPGGRPVPYANISLCPQSVPLCPTVQANGSGYFWVAGPAGVDNLTVSSGDYVTTSRLLNVSLDSWEWIGHLLIDQYAYLSGQVIGLPVGIPVQGANASICSTLVFPNAPLACAYTTVTNAVGTFNLAVPAGNYLLQVNATLFNTTIIPVQLSPGEKVDLGVIELQAYGFGQGTVLAIDTNAPIPGTTVEANPTWTTGNQTGAVPVNPATGTYTIDGPPGPYIIQAQAPGYFPSGLIVHLYSNSLSNIPTIYLQPLGSSNRFTVAGTVFSSPSADGSNATPLAGAVISDGAGDAANSGGSGQFTLSALWGSYRLSVQAPGLRVGTLNILVHSNLTGLRVVLVPQFYLWTGNVVDGLNQMPFNGTHLLDGQGRILGTTDPSGAFALELRNGSYTITTELTGLFNTNPPSYGEDTFTIAVNGAGGHELIAIYPPQRELTVTVLSATSDLPIANASVVVAGIVRPEGVGDGMTGATGSIGTVAFALFTGTFNVTALASGFIGGSSSVSVAYDSGALALTIKLAPVVVASSASSGPLTPASGILLAGGLAAIAAGAVLISRRPRAASTASLSASSPAPEARP